jgi:DNA transformation protein
VFSGELMFGLAAEEELYLRADDQNRMAFEAEGLGPFVYRMRDGEQMTLGYWRAPDAIWDDADAARRWSAGSLEAAARHKASKRKTGKTKPPELLISGPWDEG